MTDYEKHLIDNLSIVCKNSRLTFEEHEYFKKGLEYLINTFSSKQKMSEEEKKNEA